MDLSTLTIGFIGCGKISSAVARGYASFSSPPRRILVSPRSQSKAEALRADFPGLVVIVENEDIAMQSDVLFIGLLPGAANEILPALTYKEDQLIISMMAAVNFATVLRLVRREEAAAGRTARIVPLPSAAQRYGPILCHPAGLSTVEQIVGVVGTVVACAAEAEMKPLVSITGHISAFYEYLQVVQSWARTNGVDDAAARTFVSAFYSCMARNAETSTDTYAAMSHHAATPGGLNEQSVNFLWTTDHFSVLESSLDQILTRLNK